MPAFIVIGDQTDHGGVVIEATGVTETHGRRIARVGDRVQCPKKGHGTTVIVSGDYTMYIDGKPVAYHGCKTSCGATLIASQAVTTVEFGSSSSKSSNSRSASGSGAAASAATVLGNHATASADQRFLLTDKETGQPIANRLYCLTFRGQKISGRTNAKGETESVAGDVGEKVEIEVFPEGAED
jgi:uncharacterized Zn-binding protein involved in type VI secretion